MKAILEFNLDEPDDIIAHRRCVKALDMALALWTIRYNLFKDCEHAIEFNLPKDASAYQGMEVVFNKLNEIFSENNLILDDLIV